MEPLTRGRSGGMSGNLTVLQHGARVNTARAIAPATLPPRFNRAIAPAAAVDSCK